MKSITESFCENFARFKHRNIILYGIGFQTQILCTELSGFRIVGLMDHNPENVGKIVCGKKILDSAEVALRDAIIVIISKEENQVRIYRDIKHLTDSHGCEIFFQNGQSASLLTEVQEFDNKAVKRVNRKRVIDLIDAHDIISFDLFGTLLERNVSRPDGVFRLIERCLVDTFGLSYDFAFKRMQAEGVCMTKAPFRYLLGDIYRTLGEESDIPVEKLNRIKDMEISLELKYASPRLDVIRIFNYAVSRKKTVNLISDMYLPMEVLKQMLKKVGVSGYDNLLISGELGLTKQDGSIWVDYSQDFYPSANCLHIGDNLIADCNEAEKNSIRACLLMNSYDLMLETPLRETLANVRIPESAVMSGLICNCLFGNPFSDDKECDGFTLNCCMDIGYAFFGPIVFDYLVRLYKYAKGMKINKVLFCAREGYLLTSLFTELLDHIDKKDSTIAAVYFKTSRRMAINASLATEDDIYESLRKIRFYGTFSDLLKNRFGVEGRADDEHIELIANTRENLEEIRKWLAEYIPEILRNASEEKENYLGYISTIYDKTLDKAVFSDVGFHGTIQHHINKILDDDIHGFYLTALTDEENPYGLDNIQGVHSVSSELYKALYLFESVITGPEGMYLKCDNRGRFINGPLRGNQMNFEYKKQIHSGIRKFMLDMISLDSRFADRSYDSVFADRMFGMLVRVYPFINSEIRDTFYYDNFFTRTDENVIRP